MDMFASDSDYESYTETTDSEEQDDNESVYGGHAQNILSSLEKSIGRIDHFLEFERGFVHGDIVCSVKDPSGQLGRVVDIDMIVDLETSSGELIKDVNSKKLIKVRSFAVGDYVVQGSWLGRVERVFDVVTILFNDGARCEIMTGDLEILIPVSPSIYEDAPYPYYPGQRVRIKLPTFSKSVRWLCGSWKASRDEGTVCHVEVGLLHVNWIASVMIGCGVTPSTPPSLQDPKVLTVLSCFPHANWQLGDWCILPSDYFHPENFACRSLAPQCIAKMQEKFGTNEPGFKKMFVISKTKMKADVLWQDGAKSVGLDSHALLPVNNIGDHDFWPEQYVLEKVTSEDVQVPDGQRLGIVKNVDAQERTVKVKWIGPELKQTGRSLKECNEETVSAYELVEHPDFSYCIGDIVFRLSPHFGKNGDFLDRKANGLWKNNDLLFKTSLLHGKDTLEKDICDGHDGSITSYLSCIGNVMGFKDEGIEVKWASGLTSKIWPSEIFGLDRLDDIVSTPALNEDALPENISRDMFEQEKPSSQMKEKVIIDSSEVHKNDTWDAGAFFLPRAAIGFLTNVAMSLFGSRGSTSLLGSWKGVSELQSLKTEELKGNVNVQKENLDPPVDETKQDEQPIFSPDKKTPGKFKQFDIVDDYSDHHFMNGVGKGLPSSQVKRGWLKKIQQEWSTLEKNLPDSIHVRVYEERIDLLRASIAGAHGTPYHDGLFFFDIFFPPDYPNEPPLVHYNSCGLRLNPNLYESGKVCLSLLNTWTGTSSEVWNPNSTILQVLLSIQALVLNEKPYFNEAGYDKQIGRAEGEKNSVTYNENAFILSCKTMLYLLRKPPKNFEALIGEHFSRRSHHILLACKAYMEGVQVGCPFERGKMSGEGQKGSSTGFKIMLAKLFPRLVTVFTEKGIDCSQFLDQVNQVPDTGENLDLI